MMLTKVISGGQSGADIAGIKIAKRFGLQTGGHIPKGFKTAFGPKPEYATLYNLIEHSSPDYPPRTAENVKNSDGTIRLAFNFDSAGEKLTLKLINQYNKPHLDVNLNNPITNEQINKIIVWIQDKDIKTLNVAGNSEKTSPGTEKVVMTILASVFRHFALSLPIRSCTSCSLYKSMPLGCPVPGVGPLNTKIMIVGEALGEDESLMEIPFVGRAGKQLDEILKSAKIDRKLVYITNTVKCRPTEKQGKYVKNRPPTQEEIYACKGLLWKEMKIIKPKVIVTLGKVPTGLLLQLPKTFKLLDIVGKQHKMYYTESVIVPAFHPSFLMQHGKQYVDTTIQVFNDIREYVEANSN